MTNELPDTLHSTRVLRAWEFVALSLGLAIDAVGKPSTERYDATRIADPGLRAILFR